MLSAAIPELCTIEPFSVLFHYNDPPIHMNRKRLFLAVSVALESALSHAESLSRSALDAALGLQGNTPMPQD
jgi:hypothetical protein